MIEMKCNECLTIFEAEAVDSFCPACNSGHVAMTPVFDVQINEEIL